MRKPDGPPPRVALIITPQYLPLLGGMERECALLSGEFARRGFAPVVITEQLGMDLPRTETVGPLRIHRIPSSPRRTLAVQVAVAARMALLTLRHRRSADFAIVRTTTLPAVLIGLLKKLRLIHFPTLVTAETGGEADDVVALAERPLFGLSRALVSANDCLNGLCQANADHLREYGFPRDKITMIPNGIDTSAWDRTEPPRRVQRLLFLGRLDAAKGLFELLDALHEVRRRHPDLSLTLAGSGPERDALVKRIAALGLGEAVALRGLVPYEQLGALFDEHDCLVLPSYSEGMPLSVLEAAAHRRVMVISDVGDIRLLFGERIRIVPPRDTPALAEAIEDAVDDTAPSADYQAVIDTVAIEAVAQRMLDRLGVARPTRESHDSVVTMPKSPTRS